MHIFCATVTLHDSNIPTLDSIPNLLAHIRRIVNFPDAIRLIHPPGYAMSSPRPLAGRLVPLRTKDEVRASLETHSVYVVEVPAKFANVIKE